MVQHAQEHHDIEIADGGGRKPAHIVDAVFGVGAQHSRAVRKLSNGVESTAIICAPRRSIETEPAVPGADVQYPLAAQILRQTEEFEPTAEVFVRLQPGSMLPSGS